MAIDLQTNPKQSDGTKISSNPNQNPGDISTTSDSSLFTPEQRQILGNVYRLNLGRQCEGLMKAKQSVTPAVPILLPEERQA